MAKHEQRTRVVVAGVDISKLVTAVDLHCTAEEQDFVTMTVSVDRLELNHNHARTQVLTVHIAESPGEEF